MQIAARDISPPSRAEIGVVPHPRACALGNFMPPACAGLLRRVASGSAYPEGEPWAVQCRPPARSLLHHHPRIIPPDLAVELVVADGGHAVTAHGELDVRYVVAQHRVGQLFVHDEGRGSRGQGRVRRRG